MLFAGQPVGDFPCSKLIQDQMELMKELRAEYADQTVACKSDAYVEGYVSAEYERILEIPKWTSGVLPFVQHVSHACLATKLALRNALGMGIGINLGGGFHHATLDSKDANNGCLINDVLLAIKETPEIHDQRIAIVDFDAHSAGGTAKGLATFEDIAAGLFEIYDTALSDSHDVEWEQLSGDVSASEAMGILLGELQHFQPEVCFLNAGGDMTDRRFNKPPLSINDAYACHRNIINYCLDAHVPLVITLGGGYTQDALEVWKRTIDYCLELQQKK